MAITAGHRATPTPEHRAAPRRPAPRGRAPGAAARLRDNLTGHAFLIGAVRLLRLLLLVPDGPRDHHELPADPARA